MKSKFLPVEYVDTRKKYILFKNDCGVTDMARTGGIYEHYIFDFIKSNLEVNGTTIIDVGANFGFHSLEFADLVGDNGKVFAFEPQRLVYYQLCANILLNGYDNVWAYNIALGNKNESVLVENPNYYAEETINIGNSHINAYTNCHNHSVDMKKLDDYCFNDVTVLKIDVQGYEPNVLDGAVNTILKHRPYIFIEIEEPQLQIYDFKFEDISNRLAHMGYNLKKVLDAPHLVDYVAIPDKRDNSHFSFIDKVIELKPNSIHDVIPSEFFTKYDNYDYIWCGNYYEIYYALAKLVNPKSFLEIGVRFGFSFLPLMIGGDRLEYCLGYDNEEYGNNQIAIENISKYYHGNAKFEILKMNSHEIKSLPQFFDVISIDGDHCYDGKTQDLELTLDHAKYVIVDDYDYHPQVRVATDQFVINHKHKIESTHYIKSFRGTLIIVYKE